MISGIVHKEKAICDINFKLQIKQFQEFRYSPQGFDNFFWVDNDVNLLS